MDCSASQVELSHRLRGEGDVGKKFLSFGPCSANSITFQASLLATTSVKGLSRLEMHRSLNIQIYS
ncbi:hypothetical protein PILCRDRAFT_813541 [Piloderma croceum F 1598]|uniref:Uncharacterized protein n=1 Tax=Piloderma croceum (strain F 1598) TaxID=765440 RepID=A0A0C3GA21_PILCF|nr:hypothetical protein PILCRDRAFT_813541 [Piloderma croceum F 1598]